MTIAPMLIGGGIAAAGAAGLFGKKKNSAREMMDQILSQYNGINSPGIEEQKVILQNLVQQGLVTPEDAATVNLGESAYGGINLDPRAREAQMGALSQLSDIVNTLKNNPLGLPVPATGTPADTKEAAKRVLGALLQKPDVLAELETLLEALKPKPVPYLPGGGSRYPEEVKNPTKTPDDEDPF